MKRKLFGMMVAGLLAAGAARGQGGYPAAAGWEYLLSPGRAVVEGRIADHRTGELPGTFTIRVENLFEGSERMVLVRTDGEGRFRTEVELPHAQFVYADGTDYFFLFPGDTLRCRLSAGGGRQEFAGEGVSARVNRKWQEIMPRYFGDIPLPQALREGGREEVFAYRDRLVGVIDRLAEGMAEGKAEEWGEDPGMVADVLKTLVVEEAFRRIVNAEVDYRRRRGGEQQEEERRGEEEAYFGFLKGREGLLLDNPLMVCSSEQWVLFNRLEFGIYRGMYYLANRYAVPLPANARKEVGMYAALFVLPREYDGEFLGEALALRGDSLFTGRDYYGKVLEEFSGRFGVGNHFLFQLLLCRSIFTHMADSPELPPDVWAAEMANAMPYLTHPVVCRQAVEGYRRYVARREAGVAGEEATPEADSLLERITAPYRGEVLYLDFWGIGCAPCREGMLAQRELVKEMEGRPVRFLYLCGEEHAAAKEFLRRNRIGGVHVFLDRDEWNVLSAKFGFSAIPFQVVMDRKGDFHPHPASVPTRESLERFVEL